MCLSWKKSLINQALLIVRKLFFKIARTKIDIYKGILSMEFGNDVVIFNIFDVVK